MSDALEKGSAARAGALFALRAVCMAGAFTRHAEAASILTSMGCRESLTDILARYNAMRCEGGPMDDLLKRSELGLAYVNVPNSSVIWTSRPLTALWTRWQFCVFLLLIAVALIIGQSKDVSSLFHSDTSPVRWLNVDTMKIYPSPFPRLAPEQRGEDFTATRHLALVGAGLYMDGIDLSLQEACNTSLTSDSSFLMSCRENVRVHGFWVRVAWPSDLVQLQGPGAKHVKVKLADHGYAGVEYSYRVGVGSADSQVGLSRPPDRGQVFNVMGTGQTIQGKIWTVSASRSRLEGIYRFPIAELPLHQRPFRDINIALAYLVIGMMSRNTEP